MNRAHLAALLLFGICGLPPQWTAAEDDRVILAIIAHGSRHSVFTWTVPRPRLDATAWRDQTKDVSLAIRDAVRIATAALSPHDRERCHLNVVALMKPEYEQQPGWFFYMVNFTMEQHDDQIEVMVLLDGSVVQPSVREPKA